MKTLVLLLLSLCLMPAASAHTEPPPSGDWDVADETFIANSTITIDGYLRILEGGDLTLRNVTLWINSPQGDPSGVIVQDGGRLFAGDLDGDAGTPDDRTVISAVGAGSPTFLQAKAGSSISLEGVLMRHIGVRFDQASDPYQYFGVYIASSDASLRDLTIDDTYFGLLFDGVTGVHAEGMTVSGIQRHGLYVHGSHDVTVSDLVARDASDDEATILINGSTGTRLFDPYLHTSDEGGIVLDNSNGTEIWNASFEGEAIELSLIRSTAMLFNYDPAASRLWVSPASIADILTTLRFEVKRLEGVDRPVEGASVTSSEMEPELVVTRSDGMTRLVRLHLARYNGTGSREAIPVTLLVSNGNWSYNTTFEEHGTEIVTFYEGQGRPYYLEVDDPDVQALTSSSVLLTVTVEDIVHGTVDAGTVLFRITDGAPGISFSPDSGIIERDVNIVRGSASIELHTGGGPTTGLISCLSPHDEIEFSITVHDTHARLGKVHNIRSGSSAMFDASGSSGEELSYFFEFGDGTDSGWTDRAKVVHPYERSGTYEVTLTVCDENGLENSASVSVTVRESKESDTWAVVRIGLFMIGVGVIFLSMNAVLHRRADRAREARPPPEIPHVEKTRMAIKWYDRGTNLAASDVDEAMRCFEKALRLNPTLARAYHNLGLLLMSKGNLAGAREMFLNALENDPGLEDSERALRAIPRSGEVDPGDQ